MIAWINGPFGVGKTTLAKALAVRPGGPRVVDPERVGDVLKWFVWPVWRGDFQLLRAWRLAVVVELALADRLRRGGTVLVPLSVLRPSFARAFVTRLRRLGISVVHITLDADPAILRHRIANDQVEAQAADWRLKHIDVYLAARDELATLGPLVRTDGRTATEVLSEVEDLIAHAQAHLGRQL